MKKLQRGAEASGIAWPSLGGTSMDYWVPLLSAFGGAIIGSATTVGTVIVQSRRDAAKHRQDAALQLALADHSLAVDHANKHGPATVAPIAVYLAYHLKALSLASKGTLELADFAVLKNLRDSLKLLD